MKQFLFKLISKSCVCICLRPLDNRFVCQTRLKIQPLTILWRISSFVFHLKIAKCKKEKNIFRIIKFQFFAAREYFRVVKTVTKITQLLMKSQSPFSHKIIFEKKAKIALLNEVNTLMPLFKKAYQTLGLDFT